MGQMLEADGVQQLFGQTTPSATTIEVEDKQTEVLGGLFAQRVPGALLLY